MTTREPTERHPKPTTEVTSAKTADPSDVLCPTCRQRQSPIRLAIRRVGSVLGWPLIALVRFYQLVISPLTPPTCRYYPSCSAYALTAVRRHGPIKGTWMAVRRVGRCHPWAAGGVDHVPERPHTCSCADALAADAQTAGAQTAGAQTPAPQTAAPWSASADTTAKDRR